MSFTVEQKSQLAKLMATENLTVQHQKIRTARFDPQNRVLYLPIWQNMTGIIYDLLCGHEVGHALYTPASGWHDAVVDKSKPKNFKSFLNVIEDARIEKKVKRKYPGLATQFKLAYQELHRRDFFNIRGRDVNQMPFIDRLNLFTKSQYTSSWIKFSAQEELLLKKVQALETWDDVVRLTDEVYAYSKEEQMDKMLQDFENFEMSTDSYDEDYDDEYGDDYDDDSYDDFDEKDESDVKSKSKSKDSDKSSEEKSDDANNGDGNGEEEDKQSKSKSASGEDSESIDGDEDSFEDQFNRFKDSSDSWQDQFSPKCETDDSYRRNETQLLDEKCKEYLYVNIPKPILKNVITPAARVQEQLTKFYNFCVTEKNFSADHGTKLVNEFKNKNERYISLLAKEFEMRKAAKSFSKSKLADTGDIDINKLASYKFDDNIFRKVLLTPKGKNHGLVLLLDKSGSMSANMAGSIEQILVLAMFCRKVNIPFVVYGFGDSATAHICDLGISYSNYRVTDYPSFENEPYDLDFGTVRLREYMNNKMTNAEFSRCLKNMLLLKRSYEGGRTSTEVPRADCEDLSNTPLSQAIIAAAEVMKDFKQKNNLDITNLVIVHDGDSDYCNRYFLMDNENKKQSQWLEFYDKNVIVRDNKNKFEMKLTNKDSGMSKMVMQWFTKVTGSKIFGFYISSNNRDNKYVINEKYEVNFNNDKISLSDLRRVDYFQFEKLHKQLLKQMKTEKFVECSVTGYNSFFLISGGDDLKTEEEEIEITGKVTASKLKSAFMKMNKKKAINRVLVSKFIQGIAV